MTSQRVLRSLARTTRTTYACASFACAFPCGLLTKSCMAFSSVSLTSRGNETAAHATSRVLSACCGDSPIAYSAVLTCSSSRPVSRSWQ